MNVLILTPDRVGSTLLQRLITVYANLNENQQPLTINLHELTNGIVSYHNSTFDREMLGKKDGKWGYYQSLKTIAELLQNCNHDVTARLAHYHIKRRNDSTGEQLAFYEFLNENFYIVATRRQNLFEHATSWAIVGESKNLNVYNHKQKHEIFEEITRTGITVQPEIIEKYMHQYDEYLQWVDRHFCVNAWFDYERDLPCLEQFVLGLRPFAETAKTTWQDRFDIDWNAWNRMHYLLSMVLFEHEFSQEEKDFMAANIDCYTQARVWLQDIQDAGIIISCIPIKLHTLQEKSELIRNIDQCLIAYNQWVNKHQPSYALTYTPEVLTQAAQLEYTAWRGSDHTRSALTHTDITPLQLAHSDLKFDQ